jgi:hypothetical protein
MKILKCLKTQFHTHKIERALSRTLESVPRNYRKTLRMSMLIELKMLKQCFVRTVVNNARCKWISSGANPTIFEFTATTPAL